MANKVKTERNNSAYRPIILVNATFLFDLFLGKAACTSVKFFGSGEATLLLNGTFIPITATYNGYPVYQYQTSQLHQLYLYNMPITDCPMWAGGSSDTSSKSLTYWAVAMAPGSTTAIAYVFDEATTACDISGAWTVIYGGQPRVDTRSRLVMVTP